MFVPREEPADKKIRSAKFRPPDKVPDAVPV